MKKIFVYVTVLLSLTMVGVQGANGVPTLNGKITEAGTNSPVPAAYVVTFDKNKLEISHVYTNKFGKYSISIPSKVRFLSYCSADGQCSKALSIKQFSDLPSLRADFVVPKRIRM